MKTSTLKPGLLVSLSTRIRGAVFYQRREIEPEHADGEGRTAKWETERHIQDAKEFDAAVVARSRARSLVVSACCGSSFGLLCPTANESKLTDAIEEARKIADAFNDSADNARVEVYVLVGRIAHDEIEAARAIGAEMRDLLETMQAGIKAADPEVIREAANKARDLEAMLSVEVAGKVSDAIKQARTAAREIVKRVEKAGEVAAGVVSSLAVDKLAAARFAFLDLEEEKAVAPVEVAARGVELEPGPAAQAGSRRLRPLGGRVCLGPQRGGNLLSGHRPWIRHDLAS